VLIALIVSHTVARHETKLVTLCRHSRQALVKT